MVDSTEHDDMLFSMLKDCKTLPLFLNNIFGFLHRRTDFYHVAPDPNSPVGLPPGLAGQTVKQIFHHWQQKGQNSHQINASEKTNKLVAASNVQKCKEISNKFTTSDSYNGAVYENYSWSQTLLEVDITVKIPKDATVKDLLVNILPDRISVKLKTDIILLKGDLCEKCKHNEAIWSLEKNQLNIHIDKCKEKWWNCLIKTEPKLDLSLLDCSRPYEELPEEAQAKIEELQWNQERKRLGLPTSDDLVMHQMLEKSWNAEGSPFSGNFDPSIIKLN